LTKINFSKILFSCITTFFCQIQFCSAQNVLKTYLIDDHTVIIKINKAKLGITVWSDEIIQVRYTLADSFSSKKSLFLEEENFSKSNFKVSELDKQVVIKTAKLSVKINKASGQVSFFDKKGKSLLKEKADGGKSFTPTNFEGYKTQSVKQQFESPENEAIYGLGQHQDRLLNIKGYDLDLYQHNTEVYLPFFVSTKGYGLLWNNLSHTKFNSPDSILSIPKNQLTDKNGVKGGVNLSLFTDIDFKAPVDEERITTDLAVAKETPAKSAKLTGYLTPEKTGEYSFYSYADGTFTLRVNDVEVINNWAPYANARDMGRINLEKGKNYKIEVDWKRYHVNNGFEIKWRTPHNKMETSLWGKAGQEINYFVIAGANIDEIIAGYRTLTGKATILPKWAMGFWQCRERYKTQDEILNTVREFRKRQVPLDVIVQDWQYWKKDQWGSVTFEPSRYPNPAAMIDTLHKDLNTKFMISVWGKFYRNSDNFRELDNAGFLYPTPLKDSIIDFLKFQYSYYDAFNPAARKMYWKQLNEKLYSKGVDAWWMDASEPELPDHAATPENMAHFMNPTFEGAGIANLNAYPLMHTKGVFEGQIQASPNKRVAILTRSAFAGQQKYSTIVWSGDIAGEWNTLKASIPAGLSFSMSGMPYWTTDIGGFWVKRPLKNKSPAYKELFTRWYQFGAFCPIFRVHGADTEKEIWFFGDENSEAYQTQLKFNKLRYRLMPYIYSLNGMVHHQDYTIMRGLVMDFPLDKNALNIDNQFMFGPSILVNPVTDSGVTQRLVYLPKGSKWFDFWTGKIYSGGETIVAPAPLNSLPLFVKAGTIIPLGPDLQYAMEKKADPLEIRVYTGANGSFNLYEDDNINNDYLKGIYSSIPFIWNENTQTLNIGKRKGTFPEMLKERIMNIVFVDTNNGNGDLVSKKINKSISYNGNAITIKK
jgi:alpha-D-xyloside xylohydrolase